MGAGGRWGLVPDGGGGVHQRETIFVDVSPVLPSITLQVDVGWLFFLCSRGSDRISQKAR